MRRGRLAAVLAFAVAAVTLALAPSADAAEAQTLLMSQDGTETATEFAPFELHGPADLTSPVDYTLGQAYAKVDLIDMPSDKPVLVQVCFWRNKWTQETCAPKQLTSGPGTVWIELGRPADWYDSANVNPNNDPWTWDERADFSRLIIKDAETRELLKSKKCGNYCYSGNDLANRLPIRHKTQLIAVARGQQLRPIAGWQDCPSTWSQHCTGDPGNAGFGVDAGDTMNLAVGSTVRLDGKVYGGETTDVTWWKSSGPKALRWNDNRNALTPSVTFKEAGQYVLRFRATSTLGERAVDDLIVNVGVQGSPATTTSTTQPATEQDQKPTTSSSPVGVSAPESITATVGEPTTMNGRVSGGQGTIKTVWWKLRGPGGIQWADRETARPTLTFLKTGEHVVRFKASDANGYDTADVIVNVVAAGPADSGSQPEPTPDSTTDSSTSGPLGVDAGDAITVAPGVTTSLSGVVTGGTGDATVIWWMQQGPGRVTWSDKYDTSPEVSFDTVGDYVLKFKAREGTTSAVDTLLVSVVEGATTTAAAPQPESTPEAQPRDGSGPEIRISAASVTEKNNQERSTLIFSIDLSEASRNDITVEFRTADRTATDGVDYKGKTVAVVIPKWRTSAKVGIVVLGDRDVEGDETLTATISNASEGTIVTARAIGTIVDND